jgi:hypothetical protein
VSRTEQELAAASLLRHKGFLVIERGRGMSSWNVARLCEAREDTRPFYGGWWTAGDVAQVHYAGGAR